MSEYKYKWDKNPSDCVIHNRCNAVFDEQLFKEALEYLEFKLCKSSISIYLSSTGYPIFSYKGHDIRIHRVIGQYIYRDKEGKFIYHHINEDKLNAQPDNIMQTDLIEHSRHHNTGRILSEEHKRAISVAQTGKIPINQKSIIMLDKNDNIIQEFDNAYNAAQTLGILETSIVNNLKGRSKFCNKHKFIYKYEYDC